MSEDKGNKKEEVEKREKDLLNEKDLDSVSGGFWRPSPIGNSAGEVKAPSTSYIGETEKN